MFRLLSSLLIAMAIFAPSTRAAEDQKTPAKPTPDRAELEKQFAETMSNVTMVGNFTSGGKTDGLKEERYTLGEVKKQVGDIWLFPTRIQYGGHDVTLPLPLEVQWAGDTPVITLTKVAVPGLGTFTARVLIYDNQYAGTWNGGDHGGHLFGRIEKNAEKK